MSWTTVGKTDIHYEDYGDLAAQPLVLVHGNSSCIEVWHQQIEAYRPAYHVYAYDSVNHGASSNSPLGEPEPDRAEELQGFLEALHITNAVIAGHSMGGGTTLRWLTQHDGEARAVIISGSGVAPNPTTEPAPLTPAPIESLTVPLAVGGFTDAIDPFLSKRYERMRSTATRLEFLRHPRERSRPTPTGAEFEAQVGSIQTPMLVIVGALDGAAVSARHLHELLPQSKLVEVPGMQHNYYYEVAGQYIEAVDSFLASQGLPTSRVPAFS